MKIKRFQMGGEVPAPEQGGVGAPEQGGAPAQANVEEQVAQMAQQIIQQFGPEVAAALAQIIMQMLQGGGQPQPQQPTYQRKGGKLVKVAR